MVIIDVITTIKVAEEAEDMGIVIIRIIINSMSTNSKRTITNYGMEVAGS